jgi:hypothetical protein
MSTSISRATRNSLLEIDDVRTQDATLHFRLATHPSHDEGARGKLSELKNRTRFSAPHWPATKRSFKAFPEMFTCRPTPHFSADVPVAFLAAFELAACASSVVQTRACVTNAGELSTSMFWCSGKSFAPALCACAVMVQLRMRATCRRAKSV